MMMQVYSNHLIQEEVDMRFLAYLSKCPNMMALGSISNYIYVNRRIYLDPLKEEEEDNDYKFAKMGIILSNVLLSIST